MAYNRDLQEDKPPLFDSFDTVSSCLELAAPIVAGAELNRKAISERLDCGYLDATTLMEYLIKRSVPQRTAHHLVGELVGQAMQKGVRLADLTIDEFKTAHEEIDETVFGRTRCRARNCCFCELRINRTCGSGKTDYTMAGEAERGVNKYRVPSTPY